MYLCTYEMYPVPLRIQSLRYWIRFSPESKASPVHLQNRTAPYGPAPAHPVVLSSLISPLLIKPFDSQKKNQAILVVRKAHLSLGFHLPRRLNPNRTRHHTKPSRPGRHLSFPSPVLRPPRKKNQKKKAINKCSPSSAWAPAYIRTAGSSRLATAHVIIWLVRILVHDLAGCSLLSPQTEEIKPKETV